MAFASRILSRSASRQLYGGKAMVQAEQMVLARSYAQGTLQETPRESEGDKILKNIFLDVKNKFETAMGILRKEKITIDPEDPAAVSHYANVMKMIREKAGLYSESQKIAYAIQTRTHNIPDARTYLKTLQDIRIKRGLSDDMGAEKMMMDALDKVEKELKKPLMRNDKQGMALLTAEFDKVNKKLGIKKEDMPKYEEKLDLAVAKSQLQELEKDCLDAMETQKKREEFKNDEIPSVKSLDIRNFL